MSKERKGAGGSGRGSRFLDRDVTWLEFNRRVLHQAVDERTPLLERVMFLSIFTSNLDEFIQKRIHRLKRMIEAGMSARRPGDRTPRETLDAMRASIIAMLQQQARVYREAIHPLLGEEGIHLLEWDDLTDDERRVAAEVFERDVFPVLTPLAVDPGHPFPFISNLSTSLAVTLRHGKGGEQLFARIKVPEVLPQWVRLETPAHRGQHRFVSLVDLIAHHLERLFPDMTVVRVMPFRVTRNADVEGDEEEADDLLEAVSDQVRQRRLEAAVRLEHGPDADPWLLELLMSELELEACDVYELPALLDYTTLKKVAALPFSELHYPPFAPTTPPALADPDGDIFAAIRAGDILVHHPYESFDASVRRFVKSAVEDPDVLAIKMTVYRTGTDSPFIPMLIRAAEAGKQVVCLVELKARFDEQENIILARALENAGVHVVYGILGLKTHTKTTLVVRREAEAVRCYAHIGTGNYHVHTARLYVDLGLLTCREELTGDLIQVFNYLTGRSGKQAYQKLLIAPVTMKEQFLGMIRREAEHQQAGRPAGVTAVMNSLEDRDVCNALYEASCAGVGIDLIVRGFCVLRPGVAGLSENIRVISIIGRFLEHSRIFYFRNGARDALDGDLFIGSGDWMRRNLEDRVECTTPIETPRLRRRIRQIIQIYLADQRSAWDMQSDGSYIERHPADDTSGDAKIGSHQALINLTRRL